MDKKEFVNRVDDFSKIEEIICSSPDDKALAILLYSPSGYGKSRFVEEFFDRHCKEYKKIKVTCHVGKEQSVNNLEFIANLYSAIYEKEPPVMNEKLSRRESAGEISGLGISFTLPTIISSDIMHSSKALMMLDFIKKRLVNGKYIIDFENFQKVDLESFELLREVYTLNTSNIFIFEYTTLTLNIEHKREIFRIQEHLNRYLKCDLFEFQSLDENALIKICSMRNIDYPLAASYFFSGDTKGDLYTIVTLQHSTLKSKKNIPLNSIPLLKDEKLILYIILLNQNKIKKEDLFELFSDNIIFLSGNKKFSIPYICKLVDKLCEKELVLEKEFDIWIYHDKIIDLYNMSKQDIIMWNAYALLKEFYLKRLKDSKDENILYLLINLCCEFSDEAILEYLPDIHLLLLEVKYPSGLVKKVSKALSKAVENILNPFFCNSIYYKFVDICFDCGDFNEAINSLGKITERDTRWDYYNSALTATIDSNELCEDVLKAYCQKYASSIYSLSFEMNLLSFYMRTKDYHYSKEYAYSLIKKYKYDTSVFYGCLLKNYTEYLENIDAIKLLKKAEIIFIQNNRQDLNALANITYASRLAYQGKICEAEKKLESSNSYLVNKRNYRMYYFLNNYSALSILEDKVDITVIKNLEKALLLVTNTYEKIIILCNLLIANLLINDMDNADLVFNSINEEDFSGFEYEELQHIIHYNFRYYYMEKKSLLSIKHEEAFLLKLAAKKTTPQDLVDYIHASLYHKELPDGHQWYFYSKLPYRVDFIGYWQMDLNNIESLQD